MTNQVSLINTPREPKREVFGNKPLTRKICTFLPLPELANVFKVNSCLRALRSAETLRSMLLSVNNPDIEAYQRFTAVVSPQGIMALIRQMEKIQQLKATTSDKHLFLYGLERVSHTRNLTCLDITYPRDSARNYGEVGGVVFDVLASYNQLQKLRISCSAICDRTIEPLSKILSLRELSLSGFDSSLLTTRGITLILESLRNLRALHLGNEVGKAAEVITTHGRALVELTLHDSTDHPLAVLRMIDACPHLTYLDMTYSIFAATWATRDGRGYPVHHDQALKELAQKRPKLQIKRG